jgi:hypothetical protein
MAEVRRRAGGFAGGTPPALFFASVRSAFSPLPRFFAAALFSAAVFVGPDFLILRNDLHSGFPSLNPMR